MTTSTTPLLILTCATCGADMIRGVARGLMITDGAAIVAEGFTQQCQTCSHIHVAGDVLRMKTRRFGL